MAKRKVFQISDTLADGLEETLSSAKNYSGELRVDVIPLKKIETDPENPRDLALTIDDIYNKVAPSDPDYVRKLQEINSLESIANSIKDQGIINPIVVYKHGDKYRLVAGERRTLASILAGKMDIQAKILDSKPNELKISLLQWIENIERSDLSLYERLKNLEKIARAYALSKNIGVEQITITELSQLIGCVKSHALNYRAVLNADAQIKALIFANKIKNLEKAALLSGIQSTVAREHVISACLAGATLKKLKTMVEQSKSTPSLRLPRPSLKQGRQASSVNLGSTKNRDVAKIIIDSVLKNQALAHLRDQFQQVDWSDYKTVSETFNLLLRRLEELHV